MDTEKSLLCEPDELRIVLLGKGGLTKKWAIETILNSEKGEEPHETKISPDPKEYQRFRVKIKGQDVVVFDTPGLCHTERSDEETMKEITKCISLVNSGVHGFLVVLDLGPFTQEEKNMVQMIHSSLGDTVKDYMMPLFVHGNDLKDDGKTIEWFINKNKDLKEFADGCRGKPCVIDHRNQDPKPVEELREKINMMVQENKAKQRSCYTTNMLQKVESTAENRKIMAKSVKHCMVVGATIGGVTSFIIDSMNGFQGGILSGAFVGGLIGIVGTVMYVKVKSCFTHCRCSGLTRSAGGSTSEESQNQ